MILAAGLTPAWQRMLVFDGFAPGAVNRAREAYACASGKVLNVVAAAHFLGAPARALTLAGGPIGTALRNDAATAGFDVRWIETAAPSRVCTTVLENGRTTELVENAGPANDSERAAFSRAFTEEAGRAGTIVLTGSLPAGTPPSIYRELMSSAAGRILLDARGPELLEGLSRSPFLVKPNRRELAETVGRDLSGEQELLAAMAELNERGATWVVVSDGDGPVRVRGEGKTVSFLPPAAKAVNPIGCGDCLAAGIAMTLEEGGGVIEGVRRGMAAAADNLSQILPARLDAKRVEALLNQVREA